MHNAVLRSQGELHRAAGLAWASMCKAVYHVWCRVQVSVNEEVDPELVIQRLSLENRDLKSEIRCGFSNLLKFKVMKPSSLKP